MTETYKCPSCGGILKYDPNCKKMRCQYCAQEYEVEEIAGKEEDQRERKQPDKGEEDRAEKSGGADTEKITGTFSEEDAESIEMHVYHCTSCGAEILADGDTAATFCSFCGSPTLLEDRLEGERKPAYVIPFQISKDAAREAYGLWAKKGVLTPKLFYSRSTVEKITGIYVPFWLYDYHADIFLQARCTRVRTTRKGDYEYIHTDHYMVERDLGADYNRVPADASEKMPDEVMDKLEPFHYGELEAFEMPYLSGYYAEKYSYTAQQMAPRMEYRIKNYINKAAMQSITGYATVAVKERKVTLHRNQAKYALLPVWILNCRYKGKDFLFAMNGQTGKIVADKPISWAKAAGWFSGLGIGIFAVLFSIGRFLL